MEYGTIRQNFEKHGFKTQLFATKEEATAYLADELKLKAIGFGSSATLAEMGLYEALSASNAVVWHGKVNHMDVRRLENQASVYITGANAVTETGEMVNIDATGNRISMMAFGPQVCYYVVGKNKITRDIAAAIDRCRNVAAPQNAMRLGAQTPCAVKGDRCYDCDSPGRICRAMLITERAPRSMVSEIIFIDENLGL